MRRPALLLAVAALTGCGGGSHERQVLLDGCVRAAPVHVRASGGGTSERLGAGVLGDGSTGVVLANESDLDLCGWAPFARTLAEKGYRALVFDYGSLPDEAEIAAVARELRHDGVKKVVVAGASEGAKAAILAAAADPKLADRLLALSPEAFLAGRAVAPAARRLRLSALFVVSRGDPYSARDTPELERIAGSRVKRLLVVPGSDHGVYLLRGAQRARVEAAILAFLRDA